MLIIERMEYSKIEEREKTQVREKTSKVSGQPAQQIIYRTELHFGILIFADR